MAESRVIIATFLDVDVIILRWQVFGLPLSFRVMLTLWAKCNTTLVPIMK